MTFQEDKADEFMTIFTGAQPHIAVFPGCHGVELLRDVTNRNIFFTESDWNSESDLENYRQSGLFKQTWQKTKKLFSDRAQAWSLEKK